MRKSLKLSSIPLIYFSLFSQVPTKEAESPIYCSMLEKEGWFP